MTTPDIILIIGVSTTSIVTILSAWASMKGRVDQGAKLDQIHEATNGGVQLLRDKLMAANTNIEELKAVIKTMVVKP